MMRFLKVSFVALVAFLSLAASCHPDPPQPPEPPEPPVVIVDTFYDFEPEGGSVTVTMTMGEAWTVTVTGGGSWCSLNKSSGEAGEVVVVISVSANDTFVGRECEVRISSEHSVGTIAIRQAQKDVLVVAPERLDVPSEGGIFTPEITANVEYKSIISADWLTLEEGSISVAANESEEPRTATVILYGSGLTAMVTVVHEGQLPPPPPEPQDPLDGVVTVIQTHTEGSGIPIVFMGDAFSDQQIEDETYIGLMRQAVEAFFSVEPYTTFRSLYDLYVVNVVSQYYEDFNQPGSTTLGTYFGDGAFVGGDHAKCREYALKAISEEVMDDALLVILLNREYHAGRCYMQLINTIVDGEDSLTDDCAHGIALAYLALGTDADDFVGLVRHEAGGHGFGRLADEYYYEESGVIPQIVAEQYKSVQTLNHAYMNVDFTDDPEAVLWSGFLRDDRYQYDGLGVFEGACTYASGAWRSSENSIMVSNEGGFNAPSREAIYFRMHKLAYGRAWEYNYENFVEYDAVNRAPAPSEEPHANPARRRFKACHTRCPAPEILE